MIFNIFLLVVSSLVYTTTACTKLCVTDFTASDCQTGERLEIVNNLLLGCCPTCRPIPDTPTVIEGADVCRPPSTCLPDGKFAPVQCKGDRFNGRCFCSDEDGNRLFGQMWRTEASEMTCACSRRRAELEAGGRRDVTLHCSPNGDYEHLQCDDGLCWCAEPKTGQPVAPPVLDTDMKLLPCYSASVIGEQYLRKCESLVHALGTIHREQSEHGTTFLGNPVTFCDYDGSYASYQIRNGIAYCTDREGEIMGSWQAISSDMAGMNCYCARDSAIYFPERGMTLTEICQGNGNYRPNQNVGDVYYCVDRDGYPVTGMLSEWPQDECQIYA